MEQGGCADGVLREGPQQHVFQQANLHGEEEHDGSVS